MQTQTETGEGRKTISVGLDSMERIEDRLGQWIELEEHWTQNNLDRYQQLDNARRLFKEIKAEIKAAYENSPYREN